MHKTFINELGCEAAGIDFTDLVQIKRNDR